MLSRSYKWINAAVLLMAVILFGSQMSAGFELSIRMNDCLRGGILLFGTVILVQIIKGLRLYFELYEKHMPKGLFMRQYCKVVPVSMILPGKLGDFFRAYCFGYHMRDYLAGISVIILDRFVDTLGLVTVMLAFFLMYSFMAQKLFFLLVFVLLMLWAIYTFFPGMSRYWRHYLLVQPASRRLLRRLQFLQRMQRAYWELQQVIHGKFLVAYLLSLLAWSIEIGSLAIYCKWLAGESVRSAVDAYLGSAVSGQPSTYLMEFIGFSVLALLCMYLLVAVWHYGKRGQYE